MFLEILVYRHTMPQHRVICYRLFETTTFSPKVCPRLPINTLSYPRYKETSATPPQKPKICL